MDLLDLMVLEIYPQVILVYLWIFVINEIDIIRFVVLLCLGKNWDGIEMGKIMARMKASLDVWSYLNTYSLLARFGIFIFYFICF